MGTVRPQPACGNPFTYFLARSRTKNASAKGLLYHLYDTNALCLFELLMLRRGILHVPESHFTASDFNAVTVDVRTAWRSLYSRVFNLLCNFKIIFHTLIYLLLF